MPAAMSLSDITPRIQHDTLSQPGKQSKAHDNYFALVLYFKLYTELQSRLLDKPPFNVYL